MVLIVHRNNNVIMLLRTGRRREEEVWRWGKREIMHLSLHSHHQNDSCIKIGIDESHANVSLIVRDSHKTVSTNHNLLEEKEEPKRNRAEALLLTSLTARPNRLWYG